MSDKPAFPVGPQDRFVEPDTGLTRRELFAAMAMAGISANKWAIERSDMQGEPAAIAEFAIKCADALIAELDK